MSDLHERPAVHLAGLRAFVAVVDAGGFGAAADALGISQSAVSHAVGALERTLGAPVLRRTPVAPTAFGTAVLEHARAAVAAGAAIAGLAAARAGAEPAGVVSLAAPPTVCQGMLPGLLELWRAELPRVRVRVFEGEDDEVADWLATTTVHAAVLVDPPPADRPDAAVVLSRDAFHALLPADHPLAGEASVDAADLADDPFLLSAGGCEAHVRECFRRAGTPLRPTHRVREMGTLFAMVRAGVGVSVVPGLTATMLDRRLTLVPLRPEVTRTLLLTGPPGRPWPPAVTALVAAARRHRGR